MKIRVITRHFNNNGVALLLAVTVISILFAVTVQFSKDMRTELVNSANILSSSKMSVLVKSGYNVGVALLELDGKDNKFISDSFHDSWAELGSSDLDQLYENTKLKVEIFDLSGRLQLNSLVDPKSGKHDGKVAKASREFLHRLLLSGKFGQLDLSDVELISDSIIDWIDPDNSETGLDGAESSYYEGLEPAYKSKNGPIDFIEELLLIRGITSDLYNGNKDFQGLKDYVTVHGTDGKININTAPTLVIQAMGKDITEDMAGDLMDFRNNETNRDRLKDPNWYKNEIPSVKMLVAPTTKSTFFRINATAERNNITKTLQAVVQRKPNNEITMISRKVE